MLVGENGSASEKNMTVDSVIFTPEYDCGTDYNLALIRLKSELEYNQEVCLSHAPRSSASLCTTTGCVSAGHSLSYDCGHNE